ncbi:MAG TPA: hypothetical protein VI454_15650 [Verrucomicrobiae bacterium]
MTQSEAAPRPAWQPFTFGGVAAFARATFMRTLLAALAMAVVVALLVFAAFDFGWLPTIDAAVEQLPDAGEIRGRQLRWPSATPRVLAETSLLQLVVDVEGEGAFGHEADLRVELRRDEFRLCGALGCWARPYPEGWIIALNRSDLVPSWGAWRPFVLWGVFLGAIVFLLASWTLVAVVGSLPLRLATFYLDRDVTLGGCCRVVFIALPPGAMFLGTVIFFYGLGRLNLFELAMYFAAHFLIGLTYVAGGAWRLPRVSDALPATAANPFAPPPDPPSPP